MIHVNKNKVIVTGPAPEVSAELAMVIASLAATLERQGADKAFLSRLFYGIVDVALEAPKAGTSIDLSFRKES